MTTNPALDGAVHTALPIIETVGEAAAEIARLYAALDKTAVNLTPEYINQRLAGEEGVTWAMFPRIGLRRRPTPILDAVIRRGGAILLGAGYNMWWEMLNEYQLAKVAILVPGSDGTFVKVDAITVHCAGKGFDPGDEYIVLGDQVLKAGHDHFVSMPALGSDGKFAWSAPRDFINGTFRALTEVSPEVRQVITRLRAYEPAIGAAT